MSPSLPLDLHFRNHALFPQPKMQHHEHRRTRQRVEGCWRSPGTSFTKIINQNHQLTLQTPGQPIECQPTDSS
ncbi:hypothetical protein TNCV_3917661 [Trichonephila clavipes]|nr:hypothetical protein TNCV_3917661 [Trichonephila clavipes]